ncbi:hypothetical protein PENTCL1PPCAC_13622, partial [Pristionchus entomophagus]
YNTVTHSDVSCRSTLENGTQRHRRTRPSSGGIKNMATPASKPRPQVAAAAANAAAPMGIHLQSPAGRCYGANHEDYCCFYRVCHEYDKVEHAVE